MHTEGNDPDWNSEDLSSDDSTTSDTEPRDFMDYVTNLRSCAEIPNTDTNSTHADSPKETPIQEDLSFEYELVKAVSELKESCTAFSLVAPPDDTISPSGNHIFEAPSVQETPLISCDVSIAELNTLRQKLDTSIRTTKKLLKALRRQKSHNKRLASNCSQLQDDLNKSKEETKIMSVRYDIAMRECNELKQKLEISTASREAMVRNQLDTIKVLQSLKQQLPRILEQRSQEARKAVNPKGGRPWKKRNFNQLGLPVIWKGKGRLTKTGVFTLKVLHSTGFFSQADLCHMLSLNSGTCSVLLRKTNTFVDQEIKSVVYAQNSLKNWEHFDKAQDLFATVMAQHKTHRTLSSLRRTFFKESCGEVVPSRYKMRSLCYYNGYSITALDL